MASNFWKCGKCKNSNQYWNRKCEVCSVRRPKYDDSGSDDDDSSHSKKDHRKNGYKSASDRRDHKSGRSHSNTKSRSYDRNYNDTKSRREDKHRKDEDGWNCSKCKHDNRDSRINCSKCKTPRYGRADKGSPVSKRSGKKGRRSSSSSSSLSDDGSDSDYGKKPSSRSKRYKNDEIRIVLLGKTGSGKSASGNTILDGDYFSSAISGESVTKKCRRREAERFGKSISVVDTPGVFDTSTPNHIVTKEIVKCIGMSSPGPHAFLLVVSVGRFTQEEYESVQHFVDNFGDDAFGYMIVLFTRKDDLDHENVSLREHIKSVPKNLKSVLKNCSNRCIAFNNRAKGREQNRQVEELLEMIDDMIKENRGKYYTNDMFEEAEKVMKEREDEIRREQKEERDRDRKKIEREVGRKYKQEISQHRDTQQQLEMRIAELESKRDYRRTERRKKKGSLEQQIHDTKRQISRDKKEGKNTKHLQKRLEKLERERDNEDNNEGNEETETSKEVELLRKELKDMQENEKEMERTRDKQLKRQLKEHERKFRELEKKNPRKKVREEVEKEEMSLGDKILKGLASVGKAILKIIF